MTVRMYFWYQVIDTLEKNDGEKNERILLSLSILKFSVDISLERQIKCFIRTLRLHYFYLQDLL